MGRNVITSAWRKSSYSDTNGNCAEAASGGGVILLRDTNDRDGGTLTFGAATWLDFVASLR